MPDLTPSPSCGATILLCRSIWILSMSETGHGQIERSSFCDSRSEAMAAPPIADEATTNGPAGVSPIRMNRMPFHTVCPLKASMANISSMLSDAPVRAHFQCIAPV